jgi:hypothetical protein
MIVTIEIGDQPRPFALLQCAVAGHPAFLIDADYCRERGAHNDVFFCPDCRAAVYLRSEVTSVAELNAGRYERMTKEH